MTGRVIETATRTGIQRHIPSAGTLFLTSNLPHRIAHVPCRLKLPHIKETSISQDTLGKSYEDLMKRIGDIS